MELGSILKFLDGSSILITGATGFLAKIFVEKILRVQPNVKKLYLLVRAADSKSASQRFHNEAIAKDLFRVVRDKHGADLSSFLSEKITPVAGDITLENLGINDSDLIEKMMQEVDVVVNVAATTNFDERYDVSLQLNTFGAKNVLDFAKTCVNIKMLLHVSTAYVSGEKAGLISENRLYMGETLNGASGLNIETEKKIIEEKLRDLRAQGLTESEITMEMKDLGIARARKFGWPNTYVFTKAMGEMIIGSLKDNIPLVILRPTIISSTFRDPFPGWVEGIRTIDSFAVGYGKGKLTFFLADPDSILDVIPADMVVNAMIVAIVAHASEASSEIIYHVGSSVSNPVSLTSIKDYGYRYFTKHPWIGKDGKAVKVGKVTVFKTMSAFTRYMAIHYLLPLKGLQLVNTALCQYFQGTYHDLHRKIRFVMRLMELYQPYLFFKGVYDDMNTEKLRIATRRSENGEDEFYFDPKIINWEDYFINTHIPGVVKYVFK